MTPTTESNAVNFLNIRSYGKSRIWEAFGTTRLHTLSPNNLLIYGNVCANFIHHNVIVANQKHVETKLGHPKQALEEQICYLVAEGGDQDTQDDARRMYESQRARDDLKGRPRWEASPRQCIDLTLYKAKCLVGWGQELGQLIRVIRLSKGWNPELILVNKKLG